MNPGKIDKVLLLRLENTLAMKSPEDTNRFDRLTKGKKTNLRPIYFWDGIKVTIRVKHKKI